MARKVLVLDEHPVGVLIWLYRNLVAVASGLEERVDLSLVLFYEAFDAATLLADFWQAVDAVLKERGVL